MTNSFGSHDTSKLARYYRLHAPIYDATRWSFLFGREELLSMLPDLPPQARILEIGCGTGQNIARLEYYFPDARIMGIDLSPNMLAKAGQRLGSSTRAELRLESYNAESFSGDSFDLILLSYSLTMLEDRTQQVFDSILKDMKPNGYLAVVDFNTTPFRWFRHWMDINHADLSGHALPLLKKYFHPLTVEIHRAYFGLWTYFQFIGKP
ncbi:class I SAM-dependent methyltransferase [Fodinibius sediminis]|uniref:S-adenosylmethionine-diacylgycerolhomoserine-N-methlytransferase n=1 Tax=Fodinibius sediminis TaxID=1214077 RepID=A0A521E591_9BACT|nr:class I SAM-dependent methyltransferase [Fodinibius sediminis]SMO79077.1 S-adenosylmethionine-diacylgycerolhomoserine-N-methlytransferase [Fodinibius sediminis]